VSWYQKGETNLDFTEARDSEWQWHQRGRMQICTSLQTDNHASTPPLSFFTGRMPFLPPNQQRQSTEGNWLRWSYSSYQDFSLQLTVTWVAWQQLSASCLSLNCMECCSFYHATICYHATVSVISQCSVETVEQIKLHFDMGAFFDLSYSMLYDISSTPKIRVLNSGLVPEQVSHFINKLINS